MVSKRDKVPQLGFWDDEVSAPTHDKIVMWAYNNADLLVRKFLTQFPDRMHYDALNDIFTPEDIEGGHDLPKADISPLPPKPLSLVAKKILEPVIKRHPEHGRGMPQILGYADLVITWNEQHVWWSSTDTKWNTSVRERPILVEVKTKLPSMGELLRQINLYREVYQNVIVIAPNDDYADILLEQHILFIQYPGEPKN